MQFAILQLFLPLRLTEIVHDAGDHLDDDFLYTDTRRHRVICWQWRWLWQWLLAVASLPRKPCENRIYARSLRHSYGASMAFLQRLKILQARCGWIRL